MKLLSACLISIISALTLNFSVSAHGDFGFPQVSEGQINEALEKTVPLRFLPSHPLYFLITVKETFLRILKPSAAKKAQFELILSGKRLKESYLLLENNQDRLSSKTLLRYSSRLDLMIVQLQRARSQNQDTATLIGETADTLKHHEVLLSAIESSWQNRQDRYNFDQNLKQAVSSFSSAVSVIDTFNPGIKDRFQLTKTQEEERDIETSPSVQPRKIIY